MLKLLVSALVLVLLFRSVEINQVLELRGKFLPLYLFLFFLISWPMIWASSMKWKLFISKKNSSPSVWPLMKIYLVSYFANLFLPSTLGGDAVRSFKLGKEISNQAEAFSATFFERLTGLITLALVVCIGLFFSNDKNEALLVSAISFFFISLFSLILMCSKMGKLICLFFIRRIPLKKLALKIEKVFLSTDTEIFLKPFFLFKAFLWSLLFYVLAIINTYLGALSISCFTVSFVDLFYVVPIVLMVTMIPLTPGSLGIQEGAFVFFLSKIGASPSEALGIALLLRIKGLFLALVGWYFHSSSSAKN